MGQTLAGDLRHVHQTIALAEEVHESAEIHQLHHTAGIDLAFFRLGHDRPDHVIGALDRIRVVRRDLDDAIVVDVDLGTRGFHDLADDLSARPDDFADLVGGDGQRFDLGRVFAEALRGRQRLVHLAQDVQAAVLGLCQRLFHDFGRDARNLDVHLQAGDAILRAGHLEVHVAQVVFVPQDVGQNGILAVFFQDQAHRHARNGCLQRNARIHHRQRAATDRGHRGRAVGFGDLGDNADGIGEVGCRRQNRLQRPPGQLAMADLAASGRADTAHLADRIGREVVVQQEVRAAVAVQRVDDLLILARAQRGHDQRLGFATGEQGGAVGAGQNTGFADNRAHRPGVAPVNPGTARNDVAAQDRAFQLLDRRSQVAVGPVLVRQGSNDGGPGGVDGCGAVLLVADRKGGPHLFFACGLHAAIERRVIGGVEIERLFRRHFRQVDDQVDHRLHRRMAELHSAQHFGLGQLIGFRFHHHHGVFGAGNDQIKPLLGVAAQFLHVVDRRVQHVFAVREADAGRTDWPHEGNAGNRQGGRGRDHGDDIGFIVQIVAQHRGHHQHFVPEAIHEQRAAGPVDQTRGQRLFLGRARFALEEAAGDFSGRIVFFLVVHGQREKVLPRLCRFREGDIGHDAGLAQRGNHGSICLTGNLARFQCQRFAAPLD